VTIILGADRVNLGCGDNLWDGWLNVDSMDKLPTATADFLKYDLDRSERWVFPFEGVRRWHASHLLEHIRNPLNLLEAMHKASEPGALAIFRTPYGTSDDAWEDPTHVRPYFLGSWGYFGQPFYWKADYGYRGDWTVDQVFLRLTPGLDPEDSEMVLNRIRHGRNMVTEMIAVLTAQHPIRPRERTGDTLPVALLRDDEEPGLPLD
jgi:hypothetical protein